MDTAPLRPARRDYEGRSMAEHINESVSVALWSNHTTNKTVPYSLYWHGRRYHITTVGLHHTVREGRVLTHIFSVTDGTTFFKLKFDTETLGWKLLEVADGF
jgi:hypothetical protein